MFENVRFGDSGQNDPAEKNSHRINFRSGNFAVSISTNNKNNLSNSWF